MNRQIALARSIAVLSTAMLLAACTSAPIEVVNTPTPSATPEAENPWQQQYVYAGDELLRWGDDINSHIILTTFGSGSCPHTPITLEVVDPTTLSVTFEPPSGKACTADLRPTAFAAAQPPELDTFQTMTVLVDGEPIGTLAPLQA